MRSKRGSYGLLGLLAFAAACSSQMGSTESTLGSSTAAFSIGSQTAQEKAFTAFESGQVRPLALSADGSLLYATNTPDNRLEIFRVGPRGLVSVASVPVGLEPVAVAVRNNGEIWVVNHLSDSVSIIDASIPERAHVSRTLLVGDEPRDIVFAGPGGARAFVTTAHRGQNTGRDPQLTTPGAGRADVWVFDANNLGATLAGTPLTVVTLFADTPRALTVAPDGNTVYAAAFQSGNRTTSLSERIVTPGQGLPPPHTNVQGYPEPPTSIIVKYRSDPNDGGKLHWLDVEGRQWDANVKLSLPDKDVFAIDATANPPVAKPTGVFAGVGTVLFDMAVNPVNGHVYVANTDARNDVRFEGHDVTGAQQGAPPGTVEGHIAESHITVIDPKAGTVTPHHLNKHIDYTKDGTPAENAKSLAFPTGMAVTHDGKSLYVAALGSAKVGVFATAQLENDSFVPSTANQIALSAGGPTGLVLDETRNAIYVLTRFDNGISVLNPQTKKEVAHLSMFNPEPVSVTAGRPFLYDAALTSSHGDSACASCHIFGDFDSLAWDLGNPDDFITPIPGPFTMDPTLIEQLTNNSPLVDFAMKGPMTTQSLRGMANHGPMHWRGDRTGGTDATRLNVVASAQPNTGTFDENIAFNKFNVAFAGLLGRSGPLSDAQMQAFTNFILQVSYPPNPIRNLDDSLTPDQAAGRAFYFSSDASGNELVSDTFHNCNGCHTLDPNGNAQFGVPKPGFFGSDGRYSFEAETQFFKVPQLRNMYQKVGMFGMDQTYNPADTSGLGSFLPAPYNDNTFQGDQLRGFGFLHDGSVDTMFRFHGGSVFAQRGPSATLPANPGGFPMVDPSAAPATQFQQLEANITLRRQVESFLFAFDSNQAPIVGQQATLAGSGGADVSARIALLEARAAAGECDLVVKGFFLGSEIGFLYDPTSGTFIADKAATPHVGDAGLRLLAKINPLTFTAVPVGSGRRIGIDRDANGVLDGDQG